MRTKPKVFYTWLLPCVWVLCGITSFRFPAAEGLSLLFVYLPALWMVPFHIRAGTESQMALLGGTATILIVGIFLDRLGARTKTWLLSMAIGAICCLVTVIYFYCREALHEKSFATAAHRFDLDQPDRAPGYLLFCLTGGILIGSLVTIPATVVQRCISRARPQSMQ